MSLRDTIAAKLRGIERDIMWNQHALLDSRDQEQKARIRARLEKLEADRAALNRALELPRAAP